MLLLLRPTPAAFRPSAAIQRTFAFSSASTRRSPAQAQAPGPGPGPGTGTGIPSPVHPGLYYHRHPQAPESAYLVSYLPNPPPSLEFSPTTIGTVRFPKSRSAPTPATDTKQGQLPPISPRTLTENPDFVRLVHEVIALNLADDPWFETLAKSTTSDTHIHIADQRQPSDANRIPDPQDILGSVLVQAQRLVPESYEPNHVAYRLVTEAGLVQLPGDLHVRLKEACERVFELEKEAAAQQQRQAGDEGPAADHRS
ncbi:hypothetical protein JCM3774_005200 [Rhodotorula dairenensis]